MVSIIGWGYSKHTMGNFILCLVITTEDTWLCCTCLGEGADERGDEGTAAGLTEAVAGGGRDQEVVRKRLLVQDHCTQPIQQRGWEGHMIIGWGRHKSHDFNNKITIFQQNLTIDEILKYKHLLQECQFINFQALLELHVCMGPKS